MENTVCSYHSESFQMYCNTCKKQVCHTCIAGDRHRGHKFERLDTVAQMKRKELEEYVEKELPQRKQAISLKIETIRGLRKKNEESTDTVKGQVENRKQFVARHFEAEYQQILKDVNERSKENDRLLTKTDMFFERSMKTLEELENFCRSGLEAKPYAEIVRKHEDIDRVYSDLSSTDIPHIELHAFKESKELLPDKMKLFGKICSEVEVSLSVQVAKEDQKVYAATFCEDFDLSVVEIIEVKQMSGMWPFEGTHRVVSSLCAGSGEELWVNCQDSQKISQLDLSGTIIRTINRNTSINAITAANDQKRLFILGTSRVRQLYLDTESCSDFINPKNLYPTAMCTTDKGEVLLCLVDSFSKTDHRKSDEESKRLLQIYSDEGELWASYGKVSGKSFGLPTYVAYDNVCNIICVFDKQHGKLVAFDREANLKYQYKAKSTVAICYEPHGCLIVANQTNNTICFLDQSGRLTRELPIPMNASPRSMVLDTYGRILIGTSGGKIMKLQYYA